MSHLQMSSAVRANVLAGLSLLLLPDASATTGASLSAEQSQLITPAQQALLIESYERCVRIGLEHKLPPEESKLLGRSRSFDLDALSLLSALDIERAPRERVGGATYIRCDWFGTRGSKLPR